MRSSCGNIGLILMNRDTEEQLQQGLIKNARFVFWDYDNTLSRMPVTTGSNIKSRLSASA